MYSFNIILTELCNAHCTHCYMANNQIKKPKTLSKEKIEILLNNIPNNIDRIVLTGGEIFLVKELLYYTIKKIKEKNKNIDIGLETNGMYLYNDLINCKNELKKLKQMGVNFIRFSDDPFHENGGVNLMKVRDLKKLEDCDTPIIKYLVQDKAVPLGRAKNLDYKNISTQNCMNKDSTKDNPYLFIDIEGNVYSCPWKCVPLLGNIFYDEWFNITKNMSSSSNELILTGKIEEAISQITGEQTESLKLKSANMGQCSLCIETFESVKSL